MRRLSISVAVAAAALLVPNAALATTAPTLTGSVTPLNSPDVSLSWDDVRPLPPPVPASVTYQVQRAPAPCSAFASVGAPHTDSFSQTDTPPTDGTFCYRVMADDGATGAAASNVIQITIDTKPPVVNAVAHTGGDGCNAAFTLTGATVTDASTWTVRANGTPFSAANHYTAPGAPYAQVSVSVVATDAAGNQSAPFPVQGRVLDPSGPAATSLEVTTDPAAQKATLNWAPSVSDGAPVSYSLRTKGPQGTQTASGLAGGPVVQQNLQVDATYEFTLTPVDACDRAAAPSVRLVRLSDTTPPSQPVLTGPVFNAAAHVVGLSWAAASDNIQVDHYEILRNGVPIGATDSAAFTDAAPPQATQLSYVVRAVDTNGNTTESAPATIRIPDWQPPTAPVLVVTMLGAIPSLTWTASTDNIGVVAYDVIRDGKVLTSTGPAVLRYKDLAAPRGMHVWQVRARDDQGLSAISAGRQLKVQKSTSRVSVVGTRLAGHRGGAARYSLKARARLLIDLRVVGTIAKPRLRLHLTSGRTRITIWRGTPGTSSLRLRLGSALAHRGSVTIKLNHPLHAGRIRLVVVSDSRVVVVAKGSHQPAVRTA